MQILTGIPHLTHGLGDYRHLRGHKPLHHHGDEQNKGGTGNGGHVVIEMALGMTAKQMPEPHQGGETAENQRHAGHLTEVFLDVQVFHHPLHHARGYQPIEGQHENAHDQ